MIDWHSLYAYDNGNLISKKLGRPVGSVLRNGYVYISVKGKLYTAHRIIWIMHHGPIQIGLRIDHVNMVKADNRIENLRLATPTQNNIHRPKCKGGRSSRFIGVYFDRPRKKYVANISVANKTKYLGGFESEIEAALAYNQAAVQLHGKFACLNEVGIG